MAVIGSLSTLRAQLVRHPSFDVAFAYLDALGRPHSELNQRLSRLVPGDNQRQDLERGVFALEQCYLTKPRSAGKMESHLQYIDIQVVVDGAEIMLVQDIRHLTVTENLTPAKDLIFYQDAPTSSAVRFVAGEAAVYFPADGHMPGLAIAEPIPVRKIVLKVPVLA